ncbi:MAG: S1 RNA-binding domain-containing protein [Myxococcota bacterium]|nr:S1 RNA-binding domain-containing protein [Myxococcota bacterium]
MADRIRTIRRKKGEKPPEKPALDAAEASDTTSESTPTAAPPAPAPKPEPGPRIDAAALEAEANALGPDAMATLMSGSLPSDPTPGQRVKGVVASISQDTVFVNIGAKAEGMLARADMANPETIQEGDPVTAFVVTVDGRGIQLAERRSAGGSREMLEEAHKKRIPIEGRVLSRNPGGFTVDVSGVHAFCPASQIARRPDPNPDSYVGETLLMFITEFKERDVVVSAKAYEEVEAAEDAENAWTTLSEGDTKEGTVVTVSEFGVFVDIGGVQGLLHKSELGSGADVEMPAKGETLLVRVKSMDRTKDRISLSLNDPAPGPWASVGTDFVEGEKYTGTVSRVVDFGAFVTLAEGLEGLVHVSQLSDHRVDHPRSVVKVGQSVEVEIVEIDAERKRIGLTMKKDGGDGRNDWNRHKSSQKKAAKSQSLGTFADLLGDLKLG